MKFLQIPVALAFLVSSCSYKITREGYNAPYTTQTDCNVTITYGPLSSIENNAQLLGSIVLDDGGFTNHCSESEAMLILKNETNVVTATAGYAVGFVIGYLLVSFLF